MMFIMFYEWYISLSWTVYDRLHTTWFTLTISFNGHFHMRHKDFFLWTIDFIDIILFEMRFCCLSYCWLKIHNDLAPNYLDTTTVLFTLNSRYELRSEYRCNLAQTIKKSYYSNLTAQSLSTPIWNNIPEHMKSAITVNTFKSMLKKHLFYTY